MKTVTLDCQAGNHKWERQAQRGRKPLDCPEHSTKKVVAPKTSETASQVVSAVLTGEKRAEHLMMMLRSRGTALSQT